MTELVKKMIEGANEIKEDDVTSALELIVLVFVFISTTLAIAPIV